MSAPDSSTAERLSAVADVLVAAEGRLDADLVEQCRSVVAAGSARLGHGGDHTVVALAGATGSGKSSLFNAIAGEEIARSGVLRPTTSNAEAVWWSAGAETSPADSLLDWLAVPLRHHRVDADLGGLVVLDLPDHDSVEAAHQAEVDRLVAVVDVFCWVVDPEKYADAALHDDYLRRFADHSAVTLVVLNQADRLSDDELRRCVDDLRRLLRDDGLVDVRVLTTSARTGDGIDVLRSELAAQAAEQRAHVRRVRADLDRVCRELAVACGDAVPRCPTGAEIDPLSAALAAAVDADALADAVATSHRLRSRRETGTPLLRWTASLRSDPLRAWGGADRDALPERAPSRPAAGAWAEAGVTNALDDLVESMTPNVIEPWRDRLRSIAVADRAGFTDRLDAAVAATPLPTGRPRWWAAWNALQWVATVAMIVGVLWLIALGVVEWLQLPDPPNPTIGSAPLPTLLALGGLVVSLLLALGGRVAASISADRRRAVAQRRIRAAVRDVADSEVVAPLCAEATAMAALADRTRRLASARATDR